MSDIEQKIERSSLGTKNARAARRTISPADASKIVAMAAALAQSTAPKNSGGQTADRTYTPGVRPIRPGKVPQPKETTPMAKNTGAGHRRGAVRNRSQVQTPTGWVKRDTDTGRFLDRKTDPQPFKGVRREK